MSTSGALGSLGSDLLFSVSFSIARELLDGAQEANLTEDELIGFVLVVSVVLSAVPSSLRAVRRELGHMIPWLQSSKGAKSSGVLEFFTVFLEIFRRISLSICVQLLAAHVTSRQPLRTVRVVGLFSVAVFFSFLESSSSIGVNTR
jgi:hypothetical protein